jgi:hypothetical protein
MTSSCHEVVCANAAHLGFRFVSLTATSTILYWSTVWRPPVWSFGDIGFWSALLCPLWMPAIFGRGLSQAAWLRMFLVLLPIAWYLILIAFSTHAYDIARLVRPSVFVLAGGTAISLAALAFSHQGWWRLVAVPLGIAIIVGAIEVLQKTG